MKIILSDGDIVWCLLHEPCGKERDRLVGTARARVIEPPKSPVDQRDQLIDLEIVAANPGCFVGRRISKRRAGLWLASDADEHRDFGREVARFWGAPHA